MFGVTKETKFNRSLFTPSSDALHPSAEAGSARSIASAASFLKGERSQDAICFKVGAFCSEL